MSILATLCSSLRCPLPLVRFAKATSRITQFVGLGKDSANLELILSVKMLGELEDVSANAMET